MTGDGTRFGRDRRLDLGTSLLYGAVYAAALFLIVTGFTAEPGGCGGRFDSACSGGTYARLGVGFGLVLIVAPLLHKVVPSVPYEKGVGRGTGIAALMVGAAVGIALAALAAHALA
ncbi:hypothetical protein ABZY16_29755 [Streptomyces sp. NPDC006553]|uniref:hypothetical protein n=1 Tax=Streptomyces sp. NPDC006553 TaxID=3157180 RepID=UPI0033AB21F6